MITAISQCVWPPIQTADGIVLGKIANPDELRKQPALSPELLVRLYHWGITGEKYFQGNPTDMEIVTGFTQHPAPLTISIPGAEQVETMPKRHLPLPLEVSQLLLDLRAIKTKEVAESILCKLEANPWVLQLSRRRKALKAEIKKTAGLPTEVDKAYRALKALDKTVQ